MKKKIFSLSLVLCLLSVAFHSCKDPEEPTPEPASFSFTMQGVPSFNATNTPKKIQFSNGQIQQVVNYATADGLQKWLSFEFQSIPTTGNVNLDTSFNEFHLFALLEDVREATYEFDLQEAFSNFFFYHDVHHDLLPPWGDDLDPDRVKDKKKFVRFEYRPRKAQLTISKISDYRISGHITASMYLKSAAGTGHGIDSIPLSWDKNKLYPAKFTFSNIPMVAPRPKK